MNTLSHYFLEREHPSPWFKTGTVLPDILKPFNRHFRKPVFEYKGEPEPHEQQLVSGIERHFLTDKLFHNHPAFHRFTQLIKQMLLESPAEKLHYRTFFLAHIQFEMLLDRYLIQRHPGLVDSFYDNLKTTRTELLEAYFVKIKASEQWRIFKPWWERYNELQYLYHYADNEMFARALLRVYQKVRPTHMNSVETNTLKNVTETMETSYHADMGRVFNDMQLRLNGSMNS